MVVMKKKKLVIIVVGMNLMFSACVKDECTDIQNSTNGIVQNYENVQNETVQTDALNNITEAYVSDERYSEMDTDSLGVEKIIDTDAAIRIGDFSVSIYESEQEILKKLDMDGLKYEKVDDSDIVACDYYYDIDDGTDGFVQIYFLSEECVRIRISCNEVFAYTSKGIHPRNTYSQMVEQYGDSYETHTYTGKEIYTIYRYKLGEYFHEFGIAGEASDTIYNVEIYVSSQFPIYDYGEELIESKDFS